MRTRIRLIAVAAYFLAFTLPAHADTFYMIVYGSESKPKQPRHSHSWATFVRVPDPAGKQAEWFTVSWLPCEGILHPSRLFPEPGRNWELHATFDLVLSQCQVLTAFGPYQICPELYSRALCHKRTLESGKIAYKVIDTTSDPRRVSNCIHALTFISTVRPEPFVGRTNFGDVASFEITRNYSSDIINPCVTHDWVADLVGVRRYPIEWRTLAMGKPSR